MEVWGLRGARYMEEEEGEEEDEPHRFEEEAPRLLEGRLLVGEQHRAHR